MIPDYYDEDNMPEKYQKISQWMRAATRQERDIVCSMTGTTKNYIYQLAGGHRTNPSLRLAVSLVKAMNKVREQRMLPGEPDARCALPRIHLEDFIRD